MSYSIFIHKYGSDGDGGREPWRRVCPDGDPDRTDLMVLLETPDVHKPWAGETQFDPG